MTVVHTYFYIEVVFFAKAGIYKCSIKQSLSQLAVRSKVWVCGRPLAEIVVSNPGGGMDFRLFGCFVLSGKFSASS